LELPIDHFGLESGDRESSTGDQPLPAVHGELLIGVWPLPTGHRAVPIGVSPVPAGHRELQIVVSPLLIGVSPRPTRVLAPETAHGGLNTGASPLAFALFRGARLLAAAQNGGRPAAAGGQPVRAGVPHWAIGGLALKCLALPSHSRHSGLPA
jgi:hypothetical protein